MNDETGSHSEGLKGESYWDGYYRSLSQIDNLSLKQDSPGLPKASLFLQKVLEQLPKGKALDVGCGLASNSIFLAQNGFEVEGVDFSAEALSKAQELIQSRQADSNRIKLRKADVELWTFGLLCWDLIVLSSFRPQQDRIYSEITRSLKQGGFVLIDGAAFSGMDPSSKADSFDFERDQYFSPNEALKKFRELEILYYNEVTAFFPDKPQDRVWLLARKPLDKDVEKYGLFGPGSMSAHKTESISRMDSSAKIKERAEALFKSTPKK